MSYGQAADLLVFQNKYVGSCSKSNRVGARPEQCIDHLAGIVLTKMDCAVMQCSLKPVQAYPRHRVCGHVSFIASAFQGGNHLTTSFSSLLTHLFH